MQWSRLGDVLQTRPLLRHIARRDPEARITLCADARYAGIIAAMPEPLDFWPVDLARLSALARHASSQAQAISDLRDLLARDAGTEIRNVYVLSRSRAACIFAEMLRSKTTFGYRRVDGAILSPTLLQDFEAGMANGTPPPVQLADLWTCLDEAARTSEWLSPLRSPWHGTSEEGAENIALLCDAGEETRTIPTDWLAEVATKLLERENVRITLLGARAPHPGNDRLSALSASTHRVSDHRGQTTLDQFFANLARQDRVIGPDTGGLHLAAALNVPVIGLYFGGASCLTTGPYSARAVVLQDPAWMDETAMHVVSLTDARKELPPSACTPALDENGVRYESAAWPYDLREQIASARRDFITRMAEGVTVIIPECSETHYTDELLTDLHRDLAGTAAEILLVSSGPVSRRTVPDSCRCVSSPELLTFAQACNRGAFDARFNRLLFLNNDTRFAPGELRTFLSAAPREGVCSPLIRYPDGLVQNCGVRFEQGRVVEIGHGSLETQALTEKADALSAVALLVNRKDFLALNGFDEHFVNGYEDLDLCLRARESGLSCRVVPSASVTHFRGSTAGRFSQEDPNRVRFAQRWEESLTASHSASDPDQTLTSAPLLLISAESACAAGSSLRWMWPLEERGLRPYQDFVWLTEARARRQPETLQRLLTSAKTVIVFRALETDQVQDAVLNSGRRLIVDSDDLLIGRFAADSLRGQSRRAYEDRFRRLLDRAAVITASTTLLVNALRDLGYTTLHLPTAPATQQCSPRMEARDERRELRIGFFGTPSHLLDLGSIVPALDQVLETHPDARFYWWGCRPGELAYHPQVRQGGPVVEDYTTHLRRLHRFDLDLVLVPLLPGKASRMKSAVKYFEYALAGLPAIYSAVPPYMDAVTHGITGWLADESTASWMNALNTLLTDAGLRRTVAANARRDVESRILDSRACPIVNEILNSILPAHTAQTLFDRSLAVQADHEPVC
ncbi:MAG TPA: glycosyltransferase family 9 protein [bacterium]